MPPLVFVGPRPKSWPGEKDARRAEGDVGVGGGEFSFDISKRMTRDEAKNKSYVGSVWWAMTESEEVWRRKDRYWWKGPVPEGLNGAIPETLTSVDGKMRTAEIFVD